MKFTLYGGNGGIGSSLLRSLHASRHECAVVGRDDPGGAAPGHVIYAAGVTGDFRDRPYDTVHAHVTRLAQVLESGHFESLLYLSSTRIYRHAGHGSEGRPVPVDPADAESVYDLSKLAGEALCLRHPNPAVRVARLSNVVDARMARPGFLPAIVREAIVHGAVAFQSALDSERDFVAQGDLDQLLPRIAVAGKRRQYNVASGVNVSNRSLAAMLAGLTGCSFREAPGAALARHPVIDITRISTEFGFRPTDPLHAIRAAITEEIEHAARN